MMIDSLMTSVDETVAKRWPSATAGAPERWGWHDDHRHRDGTPGYLPAIQQVRSEFKGLLQGILDSASVFSVLDGKALQLGYGECEAAHKVWSGLFFRGAVTLDWKVFTEGDERLPGGDIHSLDAAAYASERAPYSFLFCDAGHTLQTVRADYERYEGLVRPGGVIAFHDTAKRQGYPEVEVWAFLLELEAQGKRVHRIGHEVGAAWIVKG